MPALFTRKHLRYLKLMLLSPRLERTITFLYLLMFLFLLGQHSPQATLQPNHSFMTLHANTTFASFKTHSHDLTSLTTWLKRGISAGPLLWHYEVLPIIRVSMYRVPLEEECYSGDLRHSVGCNVFYDPSALSRQNVSLPLPSNRSLCLSGDCAEFSL